MWKNRVRRSFVSVVLGMVLVHAAAARQAVAAATDELPPIHIAFVGDSMADGLWGAMFRRLGKDHCLARVNVSCPASCASTIETLGFSSLDVCVIPVPR